MKIQADLLDEYVTGIRKPFEEALARLVNIPTVSADPMRSRDIARGTQLASRMLQDVGFTTEIVPTSGQPVVFGRLVQDSKYPTVTIYNHIDVQPADPTEWDTDPFQLVVKGDRYFGRGATDDKGPALSALSAIIFALEKKVPINFKVIWEFEEEIGSPNFEDFIKARRSQLKTDSIIIGDGAWVGPDQPALPMGLRGMMAFEISLETASQDSHSGLAGGVARNPLGELASIITDCYDARSGHVNIPGFYDHVDSPTPHETKNFMESGFSIKQFMKDLGLNSVRTMDMADALNRLWAWPTFEVHGFTGGYSGAGVKTVIPAKATVKISTRLVPSQQPNVVFELIRSYITAKYPDAKVKLIATLDPFSMTPKGPYTEAAMNAIQDTFGKKPALVREGGSVGALLTIKKYLDVPVQMLCLSLPEQGWHAPNEFFDWTQASGGIKMYARYFSAISSFG